MKIQFDAKLNQTLVKKQNKKMYCPACSPELFPCDDFLWGYLKVKVFKHNRNITDKLKDLFVLKSQKYQRQ